MNSDERIQLDILRAARTGNFPIINRETSRQRAVNQALGQALDYGVEHCDPDKFRNALRLEEWSYIELRRNPAEPHIIWIVRLTTLGSEVLENREGL